MNERDSKRDEAARALIEACGLNMMEAAEVLLELKHSISPERELSATDCIRRLRWAQHTLKEKMVHMTLREGVARLLAGKQHRRPATLRELIHYTKKILAGNPEQAEAELSSFTPDLCREILQRSFANEHSRRKGRVVLHGLFSYCRKQGWVDKNPVSSLQERPLPEREIRPLGLGEILVLLRTLLTPAHRPCAAAAGMMLWCGIRPAEVARLSWKHVHCNTRTITLHAVHAKTGGMRCVSMPPVLLHWLRRYGLVQHGDMPVCPKGWVRRWGRLHRACGLHPWVPDILRHSFASYHAAHFRNLEQLQYEMGHHSLNLLKFRYMATGYISRQHAACFWRSAYWAAKLAE